MTLVKLVNERLHEMIVQLADDIANDDDLGLNLTEEETAGVPLMLFRVEQILRSAFERFVTGG